MANAKILDEATIAAIATPGGEGGIHMVRLSGKEALKIVSQVFHFKNASLDFKSLLPNSVHFGTIENNSKVIDEGMLAYFKSPKTYTREDMVEITIHGNYFIADKVLKLLIEKGARLAEPGEFTKRAFLNGRIDLAQAEAVLSLIHAKTELSSEVAFNQLNGRLSSEIETLKVSLMEILAEVEAFVDFPEEDIEIYSNQELLDKLTSLKNRIEKLLQSYEHGEILRDGIATVIIGKPNVGKSSLLNTLLNRDRAIVSDIPGTTRDTLEELIDLDGILFRIVDTAGLREGKDHVEKLGIERTKNYIASGRLFVFLLDNSRELSEEDEEIFKEVENKEFILVVNKSDLPSKLDRKKLENLIQGKQVLEISTETKEGIELLEKKLVETVWHGDVSEDEVVLTSQRQFEALTKSFQNLKQSEKAFTEKLSLEFLAFDLREALGAIGEVVGEVYSDDILGVIFSKFCIGK